MKESLLLLRIVLLLLFTGCSLPHSSSYRIPLGEDVRRTAKSVSVVPASYIPDNNFVSIARGRAAGAGAGAAAGILEGVKISTQFGPFFPLVLPIMVASGAATGAAVGAISAMPADEAKKLEESITTALHQINVQENLAEKVMATGSNLTGSQYTLRKSLGPAAPGDALDYHALKGQGIDIIIETGVTNIGFKSGSLPDRELSFFMTARTRVIPRHGGAAPETIVANYTSRPRKLAQWTLDGASALRQEFESAYAEIATSTIEQLFLIQNFYVDAYGVITSYCRLKPYSPQPPWPLVAPRHLLLPGGSFANDVTLRFATTDSLQPTLKWETFPTERDQEFDKSGILRKVASISYDLKLWRGQDGYPEELIYERRSLAAVPEKMRKDSESQHGLDGLAGPLSTTWDFAQPERTAEHKIDLKLEPATEYFWTVRARFDLDGQARITKWSHYRIPWIDPTLDPCLEIMIPPTHYYRFKTPKE